MTNYARVTEFLPYDWCCDERMAACPDCGAAWCLFCEDECACEVFFQ